ncbi:MAG: DUF3160 domain-containing protein, partial [Phycisphaerae bacterium]|nr:DUF3160 domain-containing protein [Phycisphaerae bacterium]
LSQEFAGVISGSNDFLVLARNSDAGTSIVYRVEAETGTATLLTEQVDGLLTGPTLNPDGTLLAVTLTDAWADKQLWTQLGAWAEQRHTWALHAKLSYTTFGSDGAGDLGMVSPYPDFFESLGKLAKGTSEVLTRADAVNDRNMKLVSADLLKHAETYTWFCEAVEGDLESVDRKRLRDSEEIVERISEFVDECVEDHRSLFGFAKRPTDAQVLKRLTELARRCLKTAKGADGDLKVLNAFVQSEIGVIERLEVLARLCGELSSIARNQLAGKSLNKEENETIRMYGPTLGYLHFYEGNSWDDPEDDSPIISPIFVNPNPRVRRTLYAALGRPHAIYVLAKLSGETRLMKGAVLSYHEFTGPTSQPLDDQAWRRIVREQKSAPPRPDFTKSFIVAPGEDKVIEMLRDGKMYVGIDSIVSRKITNTLIAMLPNIGEEDRYRLLDHLLVRCSEQDAPTLLKLLRDSAREGSKHETDSLQDIVRLVAEAPCKPIASELMKMLVAKNDDYAHAAAYILGRRPELIDAKQLTSGYDKLTTSRRGLYCMLLGALPNIDQAASKTMLKALDETDAYLRWHGAVALANSGANSPAVIKALTRRVDDSNSYVASAALNALKEIDALPNTPDLLKTLKRYCLDHRQDPKAAAELKAIEVPGHKRINSLKPRRYSMVPEPIPLDTAIVGVLTDIECKQAAPVFIDIMISGGFPMKDIGLFELGRLDRENFDKYLTDIALNDKLDFTLRSEAIRYVQFADHPIRACRRLVVLLGDKTKAPPEFPGAKSPAIGDLAIITMGKVLFPKPRDESDTGLFDPYTPVDAKAEKQRLKKVAKKVRQWAKATTQPADK